MTLLKTYLYLLFIDLAILANFYTWKSAVDKIQVFIHRHDRPVIGPVGACINFGCMIAVGP